MFFSVRLHKNLVRVLNSRRSVPLRWLFFLLLVCCLPWLVACEPVPLTDEGDRLDSVKVIFVVG